MKKLKKLLIGILSVSAAAVIVFGTVSFWHFPHYKASQFTVEASQWEADGEMRVMSCNVRCTTPQDLGKKSWFYRADLILKNIETEKPGIIGFQEVTKLQYSYLCDSLKGFDSAITYRDRSPLSEGCPVFYRTDLYTLVDRGSFWLSETPDKMSKDWGSAYCRICSYVILTDKATGKDFAVFNTHLDHISDTARINGIAVILDKIEQLGNIPSVIMGDFNAKENSETYKNATKKLLDVKYQTLNTAAGVTYQNWGSAERSKCIDYIMISKTGFAVNSYKVITNTYGGVYPSDHFPITASLEIK